MWSEMPIGKYKGKTLPQLLLTDPDYFFWAIEQGDFFRGGLAKQAADILRKVRRIKIPKPDPANWRVEYFLTPDGKFAHFDIMNRVATAALNQAGAGSDERKTGRMALQGPMTCGK